MLNSNEPAFVALLREIRELAQNKMAIHGLAQNAIDDKVESFLIRYGFDPAGETENGYVEADRKVFVHVDHQVEAGSGHNGPFRNRTYEEAKAIYDTESQVESYFRKGLTGGGNGFQKARLVRVTTIVEELERN